MASNGGEQPPLSAMQLGGNGSGIMDDLGGNGGIAMDIKTVLEQIEASRGRYYVTEGFLVLLDALLEYGIPEKLGIGTRRPGILVYLEYIVNEIILKAPERSYEYAGERWKVTARAFQVLRTVLLKYQLIQYRLCRPTRYSQWTTTKSKTNSSYQTLYVQL